MDQRDYSRHGALGLGELIATGQISAAEALAAARPRLDAIDPRRNCVVTRMDDQAASHAEQPASGVFAHVPFLLKDLFQNHAGVTTTYRNRALRRTDFRPAVHAEIVKRFLGTVAVSYDAAPMTIFSQEQGAASVP